MSYEKRLAEICAKHYLEGWDSEYYENELKGYRQAGYSFQEAIEEVFGDVPVTVLGVVEKLREFESVEDAVMVLFGELEECGECPDEGIDYDPNTLDQEFMGAAQATILPKVLEMIKTVALSVYPEINLASLAHMPAKKTGKVRFFDIKKRYGIIDGDDGVELYLNAAELPKGVRVKQGTHVQYDLAHPRKPGQKPRAINVVMKA